MVAHPVLTVVVAASLLAGGGTTLTSDERDVQRATPNAKSDQADSAEQWSLGHGYARRGNHIYFDGVRVDESGRATLEEFAATLGRPLTLAHDIDAASFVALSAEYAKDKRTVYYKWISPGLFWLVTIPGADPASFEVMDFNLAKDAHRVWRADLPIDGADAASARVVHAGQTWKDDRSVYYQSTRLAGADPQSFRHLDQAFYRDATKVYWSTSRLDGADVNTFRTFGNDVPYAADEQAVWCGENRLTHVHAGSFRLLHNHVYADRSGVYVSGHGLRVLGADAVTFRKVAELGADDCVLFQDARRAYIFDPMYLEVFTLERTGDSIIVTKPVWFSAMRGTARHAATVTAIWLEDRLMEPVIEMEEGFERTPKPIWEVDKLKRMTNAIREVLARPADDRAIAPGSPTAPAVPGATGETPDPRGTP